MPRSLSSAPPHDCDRIFTPSEHVGDTPDSPNATLADDDDDDKNNISKVMMMDPWTPRPPGSFIYISPLPVIL